MEEKGQNSTDMSQNAYDRCKDVRKLSICMNVKFCPFI